MGMGFLARSTAIETVLKSSPWNTPFSGGFADWKTGLNIRNCICKVFGSIIGYSKYNKKASIAYGIDNARVRRVVLVILFKIKWPVGGGWPVRGCSDFQCVSVNLITRPSESAARAVSRCLCCRPNISH